MTEEKWKDTVYNIKENFEVSLEATEDLPEEMGPGSMEVIEFTGPMGKIRLEFLTQPLVLDKRSIGSRRIGSEAVVEYKYSDTEKVHKFKAYKLDVNSNEWEEIPLEHSSKMFF